VRFKIAAGSEAEVVSPDELREALYELVDRLRGSETKHVRAEANGQTDGTGAVTITPYIVPVGMRFKLARVVVEASGTSFAAKFTNAAGAIEVRRADKLVDGVNLNPSAAAGDQSVGIPWVQQYSGDTRPELQNGEACVVDTIGGPANTNLTVLIEGELYPLDADHRGEQQPRHRGRR
jgi:hypothetical protein